MRDEAFWMVWSPQGSAPTKMHDEEYTAVHEAERLARINPGKEFYVLVATQGRVTDDMKRVVLMNPMPF